MSYSVEDIKTVLWNTFNLEADAIELTDENNGCYKFNVFPTDDTTLDTLANMAEDLYDSELFDITTHRDYIEVEYLNPFVLERKAFKILREAITQWISFDDAQVKNLKKRFDMVHIKYHGNPFYISVMKQLTDKKKLSKKQWEELKYLIENGRTKYEAGILTTKN